MKLVLILMVSLFYCVTLKAEAITVRVALGTSQCIFVDGIKECNVRVLPYEELEFNFFKDSNGKNFSYNEMKTYIGNEVYKVTFTITKEGLDLSELQFKINLISRATSKSKESKVIKLNIKSLTELEYLSYDGVPVIIPNQRYITEVKHFINFY